MNHPKTPPGLSNTWFDPGHVESEATEPEETHWGHSALSKAQMKLPPTILICKQTPANSESASIPGFKFLPAARGWVRHMDKGFPGGMRR